MAFNRALQFAFLSLPCLIWPSCGNTTGTKQEGTDTAIGQKLHPIVTPVQPREEVSLAFDSGVCVGSGSAVTTTVKAMIITGPDNDDTTLPAGQDNMLFKEFALLYVVIADTGRNYYALDKEMYSVSDQLHYPVDTMERYYDKKKKKIVVREDSDDEIYRGEYYPRRYTGENLSLEYLGEFLAKAPKNSIALVAGIYEKKRSADSLLTILKPFTPDAFVVRAKLYEGCMH